MRRAPLHLVVKMLKPALLRLQFSAHLVECKKLDMAEEQRVFQRLRHQRPGELLEPPAERAHRSKAVMSDTLPLEQHDDILGYRLGLTVEPFCGGHQHLLEKRAIS